MSIGGCMELSDDTWDRTVDVLHPEVQQVVGSWLTAEEVVGQLSRGGRHTTVAAIHQRRRRGRLLGARVDGTWRYAPFQFRRGAVTDDIETLLRAVSCRWPADVVSWVVLPHPELDGARPMDILIDEGLTEELRLLAESFGTTDWITRRPT